MAIELPQPLVEFLKIIRINWPDINEDHVKEFGEFVHQFMSDLERIDSRAAESVKQVLGAYKATASQQFSETWTHVNETFVHPTLELGRALGDVAPAAAAVIIGLKVAAIVQLVVMAVECLLDLALGPLTFGLSDAAALATELVAAEVMSLLAQALENAILTQIVEAALTPLFNKIDETVDGMAAGAVNAVADVALGSQVQLDPDELRKIAGQFEGYGRDLTEAAQKFMSNVQSLSFTEA